MVCTKKVSKWATWMIEWKMGERQEWRLCHSPVPMCKTHTLGEIRGLATVVRPVGEWISTVTHPATIKGYQHFCWDVYGDRLWHVLLQSQGDWWCQQCHSPASLASPRLLSVRRLGDTQYETCSSSSHVVGARRWQKTRRFNWELADSSNKKTMILIWRVCKFSIWRVCKFSL